MSINIRDIAALALKIIDKRHVFHSFLKRINIRASQLALSPVLIHFNASKLRLIEVLSAFHLVEGSNQEVVFALQLVSE